MFGRRLTLFELFGFKVSVDGSWLVMAGLIVWSLAVGYFPEAAPGYPNPTYWTMALVGLVGLALSIVVHELAHSLVARHYGLSITGITLFIFGGIAEMAEEPKTPKTELLMAIAGPLMSLGLAIAIGGGVEAAAAAGVPDDNPAVAVVSYLAVINFLLGGFNMLPAFPLDGGRVLRAVLWGWRKDMLWATRMASGSGQLCGIVLIGLGAWEASDGGLLVGIWWVVVGLFVRLAAIRALRRQGARREPV